jgi:hypothetical protein
MGASPRPPGAAAVPTSTSPVGQQGLGQQGLGQQGLGQQGLGQQSLGQQSLGQQSLGQQGLGQQGLGQQGLERPSADHLAIPGYDSLSASQVVPRLAGLDPDELEAVREYEAATRGRRTILSRIAALQGG